MQDLQPRPVRAAPQKLHRPQKLRLATEIVAAYLRVRWLLWRHPLPRTVAVLREERRSRRGTRLLPCGLADGRRLGAAVERTLAPLPGNTLCLMRSLVLLDLLGRRGDEAVLVIAVAPGREVELNAHAWIELEGRPLLTPATGEFERLVTL